MFSRCAKDPNCQVCKRTKSTRTRCKTEPQKRVDGIVESINCGDLSAADHKLLTVRKESRCGHRNALLVQIEFANWIQSCHLIAQKRTERQKAPSVEWKKGPQSHWFKVAYRNNGGTPLLLAESAGQNDEWNGSIRKETL